MTLKDPGTGLLKIRASHGLDPTEQQRGIYAPGEGVTGAIFESAQPFAVPDIGREPLFLNRTQAQSEQEQPGIYRGANYSAQRAHRGVERGPPFRTGSRFQGRYSLPHDCGHLDGAVHPPQP